MPTSDDYRVTHPYWYADYTPPEADMREAWVYMQYAEGVAGEAIATQQAANFFASRDADLAAALQALTESRARFGDMEQRALAAEAVIEKVREWNTLLNGQPRYRECDDILGGSDG